MLNYTMYHDENSTPYVDVIKITTVASPLYNVIVPPKIVIMNNNKE